MSHVILFETTIRLHILKSLLKLQILFSITCLLFLSCTNHLYNKKERRFKHNFQQGSADNLYNISEILGDNYILESKEVKFATPSHKGPEAGISFPSLTSKGGYPKDILDKKGLSKLLKVRTAKRGEKVAVSFAQENIYIDPKISFINKYEILDYEILNPDKTEWHSYIAHLLGQIKKFKGFPLTEYHILPLFVGSYLTLYKVSSAEKIPYDELPLAKRIGDKLAVPLIGYPIKYCIAQIIPDINERETGQYEPNCEGIKLKYAEYIKLNEGEKQIFEYTDKPDLFPKDFFTLQESEREKYNWFYVRTIVKSPENKVVGHQLFQPANLVEFHSDSGKLNVLDASGYEILPEDKLRTLFIPVEWIDYQIERDSENLDPSFSEEAKVYDYDTNLRYFKIKFDDLVKNKIEFKGEKTLKKVFITDNYFSFNVEITHKESGAYLIKYAFFKRPVDGYTPKQWFEQDSTLFFPSFSGERKYYKNPLDYSHADHDRFLRTTRFNPKIKKIKMVLFQTNS